jgi:serine/threonine-protein kinase
VAVDRSRTPLLAAAALGTIAGVAIAVAAVSPLGSLATIAAAWLAFAIALLLGLFASPRHPAASARARGAGSYELVERIAAGGMGEVWRAKHASLVRPAAVKLIAPRLLGEKTPEEVSSIIRDFEREAQSTASLRSPHTVQLYDFGKTDDGSLYYVMELLGGLDLATLVEEEGALPPERVVHILLQICHSLAEAHRAGLIHRDIKPGNIQLTITGGDFDFVKVLDFGLVKQRGGDRVSLENAVRGTPGYLAPEAIQRRGPLDHRIDLYSVGCVAYRLLTGRHVFERKTAPQLLRAHLSDYPEPPTAPDGADIPFELELLVLELLAKDPNDRPASAGEVARRLRDIPLATPWTQERAEAWWRAHRHAEAKAALGEPTEDEATDETPSVLPVVREPSPSELRTVAERPARAALAVLQASLSVSSI